MSFEQACRATLRVGLEFCVLCYVCMVGYAAFVLANPLFEPSNDLASDLVLEVLDVEFQGTGGIDFGAGFSMILALVYVHGVAFAAVATLALELLLWPRLRRESTRQP